MYYFLNTGRHPLYLDMDFSKIQCMEKIKDAFSKIGHIIDNDADAPLESLEAVFIEEGISLAESEEYIIKSIKELKDALDSSYDETTMAYIAGAAGAYIRMMKMSMSLVMHLLASRNDIDLRKDMHLSEFRSTRQYTA